MNEGELVREREAEKDRERDKERERNQILLQVIVQCRTSVPSKCLCFRKISDTSEKPALL